jgi:hypothetical protein
VENYLLNNEVRSKALKSSLSVISASLDMIEDELEAPKAVSAEIAILRKVLRMAQDAHFEMYKLLHQMPLKL